MRADAKKNYERLMSAAREVVTKQGAEASLRDIARTAGVGLGTLYRHFSSREGLLEALLRTSFDELTASAHELSTSDAPDRALVAWLYEAVTMACNYHGVTQSMMAAIADPDSALHDACINMRTAGTQLLERAQGEGVARSDMDGTDLFALVGALAWLGDQPALAPRADHLFDVITDAILARSTTPHAAGKVRTPRPTDPPLT